MKNNVRFVEKFEVPFVLFFMFVFPKMKELVPGITSLDDVEIELLRRYSGQRELDDQRKFSGVWKHVLYEEFFYNHTQELEDEEIAKQLSSSQEKANAKLADSEDHKQTKKVIIELWYVRFKKKGKKEVSKSTQVLIPIGICSAPIV